MKHYLTLTLRLWKLLKPFHKDFYLQLILITAQQAINVFAIFLTAKVLDSIINKHFEQAFLFAAYAFIAGITRVVINYFTEIHAQNNIDFAIQQTLEEYSFKKIFNLNISQYTEDHSAVKEQVINRGENAIESIISTIVLNILPTILQILFAIGALWYYSLSVAMWTLLALIVVIFWSNRFASYHRQFIKKDIDNNDKQKKVRFESFQHLHLIRTLGIEHVYLKKYLDNRQTYMDYKKYVWNMNILHGTRRWSFLHTARVVSTFIVIYLAYSSTITAGSIYAIWSYINEANGQIFTIIQAIRQMPLRFSELEKYLDIIDRKPLFEEHGETPNLGHAITIKNLTFSYPHAESPLFNNISLTIPSGKTVAFVGTSGSGKSTIVKLLLRMYTYEEGSITIGEHELKTIDATYLRQNIGYVEQHVDLFDSTVEENITIGIHNRTKSIQQERLEEVAHLARIDQFYHRLGEKKFHTVIGEQGVKVSGGERQRIGIARAIIKNPSILIFDEATSALDSENEKYVMEAINEVSKGKTTIIVAHRLSTVRNADKIIVMEKGQIVGEGTHDELIASNPLYKNLIAHQMSNK